MKEAVLVINDFISKYGKKNIYVAYSGGADSSALLHLVVNNKLSNAIYAIHINHGISPNAEFWLETCIRQAKKLNIPIITHRLPVTIGTKNLESWLRNERYKFFKKVMYQMPNSLLLTGHHIEDQAETFILQALRGSGLSGLSSIAPQKKFANGFLLRPLLSIKKCKITSYCQKNNIEWIEDESNQCIDFRRNFIRHNVIPYLRRSLSSGLEKTLSRSAQLCAEADALLSELLTPKLKKITNPDSNSIDLTKLRAYPEGQQRFILRIWLKQKNCCTSQAQFLQIFSGVQKISGGWEYKLKEVKLYIYKNQFFVQNDRKIQLAKTPQILTWLNRNLKTNFTQEELIIRDRQPGDRCRPLYRDKSQTLKIIFQELSIRADKRKNALIIALKSSPSRIIGVYPFFICSMPSDPTT